MCFLGIVLNRFWRKSGAPRVPYLAQQSIKKVTRNSLFQGTRKSEKQLWFWRAPTSPKRSIYKQNRWFFTFSSDPVLSSKTPPKWGPWASNNEKKWCLKTICFLHVFLEALWDLILEGSGYHFGSLFVALRRTFGHLFFIIIFTSKILPKRLPNGGGFFGVFGAFGVLLAASGPPGA